LEPYASFFPVNVAMGNHEALVNYFSNPETAEEFGIDRFPFETESAEAVFATNFSNPVSELKSEDGAAYDPDPKTKDFPPYDETVFSYVHGNAAVVVLNSNYWYAYALNRYPGTSGNIHAYIMDNQLEWFKDELTKYESDKDIDHVFVTLHTPFFPNGGHVADDMWYNGKNWPRPIVAGEKVEKGIIERRDELLEVMINKSSKVRAVLSGDEHNYAKTKITEAMPRYPENWEKPKLKLTRTIYQINNGSAGAPYYAKEQTPWSDFTTNFSTQNVVVLLNVDGKSVNVEVRNPFTEELVDALELAK
jgi:3',5'-cyclic AMP phosphodiesterase CpdA